MDRLQDAPLLERCFWTFDLPLGAVQKDISINVAPWDRFTQVEITEIQRVLAEECKKAEMRELRETISQRLWRIA